MSVNVIGNAADLIICAKKNQKTKKLLRTKKFSLENK